MEDSEKQNAVRSVEKPDSSDNSPASDSVDKLRQDADLAAPTAAHNPDGKHITPNRVSENSAVATQNGHVEALFFDNSIYSNTGGFVPARNFPYPGDSKNQVIDPKSVVTGDTLKFKAPETEPPIQRQPGASVEPRSDSNQKPNSSEIRSEGSNGNQAKVAEGEAQKRLDAFIKEQGYKTEAGADGSLTVTDKTGLKIQLQTGTPEFKERMLREIANLPELDRRLLAQSGHKIQLVQKVTDADPSLANQQPRGWPPGKTWDDADGVYLGGQKSIVVAERTRNGPSMRTEGVLKHEVGHAVDAALDNVSGSKEFRDALQKDVDKLSADQRKYYSYFLQPFNAGPQEAFADVYGAVNGASSNPHETERILKDFPETAAVIRKRLDPHKQEPQPLWKDLIARLRKVI